MQLESDTLVELKSDKDVRVEADEEVSVSAQKDVSLSSSEGQVLVNAAQGPILITSQSKKRTDCVVDVGVQCKEFSHGVTCSGDKFCE